jgi:Heme/copper-type cytochrome/quinol oxidases, subunit 2
LRTLLAACVPSPVTVQGQDVASLYSVFMAAAVVVFVIVTGLIGWSIIRYVPQDLRAHHEENVQGFQWQWRFTYPDSGVQLTGQIGDPPQVVLPVGREIEFVLTSPDVIHSFYVPRFLIKRDTIPGITNRIALTINEKGIYSGQCPAAWPTIRPMRAGPA